MLDPVLERRLVKKGRSWVVALADKVGAKRVASNQYEPADQSEGMSSHLPLACL